MDQIIILDVSHLDWQAESFYDPHEFDETDLYHECVKWCDERNMQVDFKMTDPYLEVDGIEEPVIQEPEVFAHFYSEQDAVMFKLMWSEQ